MLKLIIILMWSWADMTLFFTSLWCDRYGKKVEILHMVYVLASITLLRLALNNYNCRVTSFHRKYIFLFSTITRFHLLAFLPTSISTQYISLTLTSTCACIVLNTFNNSYYFNFVLIIRVLLFIIIIAIVLTLPVPTAISIPQQVTKIKLKSYYQYDT